MASITIMFVDSENGVQNFSFNLKDDDMKEIYVANAVLAGQDEALLNQNGVPPGFIRQYTEHLAENFIKTMLTSYYSVKETNNLQKLRENMKRIEIEGVET